MSEAAEAPGVVGRTGAALRAALGRRDARWLLVGGSLGYLLVYLFTVGDLGTAPPGEPSVRVAADLSRAFATTGFFRFDAVAVVTAYGVAFVLSPLNVLVALVLSALVGANLSLTYLGLVQPKACGLASSSGVFAGAPALLSGAACCGPSILLVVGIQASAAWVAAFRFLVPLALLLLAGSLLLVGRRVDPALL